MLSVSVSLDPISLDPVSLDPLDALDALSLSICILKSRRSAFGPSSHWTQFLY